MAIISTKGVYALAAMHVLSHAPHMRAMQIKEIAAMTKISHAYLEQILSTLRKNSLVNSIRGVKGGYTLSKKAEEISVLDILTALEGDFSSVTCNVGSSVILEYFWKDINEKAQALFALKLSELDQSYQPYFYDI